MLVAVEGGGGGGDGYSGLIVMGGMNEANLLNPPLPHQKKKTSKGPGQNPKKTFYPKQKLLVICTK